MATPVAASSSTTDVPSLTPPATASSVTSSTATASSTTRRPTKRPTASTTPGAAAGSTSGSISARRNAKDQPQVEEIPIVPEEKPVVLTAFDRLPEIWQHHTPGKQRSSVIQIFGLTDAPGVCIEAITVDEIYYDLLFAHSSGLNKEQTRVFYTIMVYMRSLLRAIPEVSVEEAFAQFRVIIMHHSTLANHTRAVRNGENVTIPVLPQLSLPTITVMPPLRPVTQASLITAAADDGPLSAKSRAGDSKRTGGGVTRPSAKTSSTTGAAATSSGQGHTRSTSRSSVSGESGKTEGRPVSRASLAASKTGTTATTGRPSTSSGDTTSRTTTPRAPTTTTNTNGTLPTPTPNAASATPSLPVLDPNALDISAPIAAISSSYQAAVAATSAPLPSRWFTPENVKQITDYVSQGLFANYRLYQAAFNPTLFTPNRLPLVHDVLIEAPIVDVRQRLRDATDLDAEEKKLRDDLAKQAADEDRARVEAAAAAAAAIATAAAMADNAASRDAKGTSSVKRERKERPKAAQ